MRVLLKKKVKTCFRALGHFCGISFYWASPEWDRDNGAQTFIYYRHFQRQFLDDRMLQTNSSLDQISSRLWDRITATHFCRKIESEESFLFNAVINKTDRKRERKRGNANNIAPRTNDWFWDKSLESDKGWRCKIEKRSSKKERLKKERSFK